MRTLPAWTVAALALSLGLPASLAEAEQDGCIATGATDFTDEIFVHLVTGEAYGIRLSLGSGGTGTALYAVIAPSTCGFSPIEELLENHGSNSSPFPPGLPSVPALP